MPGGRPTKLTPAISESICRHIRAGEPPSRAAGYTDVDPGTLRRWRATATKAQAKKPRERSQHERKCVAFCAALELAEHESFALLTALQMGGAQPFVEITTTTTKDAEGKVLTTTTVEKKKSGDWRAAAHVGKWRFPHEMGDRLQLEGTEDGAPIRTVTNDETWDELEAYRRQRALKRGEVPAPAQPAAAANGHATG